MDLRFFEKIESLFKEDGFTLQTHTAGRTAMFTGTKGTATVFLHWAEGPLSKIQPATSVVWPEKPLVLPVDAVVPLLQFEGEQTTRR